MQYLDAATLEIIVSRQLLPLQAQKLRAHIAATITAEAKAQAHLLRQQQEAAAAAAAREAAAIAAREAAARKAEAREAATREAAAREAAAREAARREAAARETAAREAAKLLREVQEVILIICVGLPFPSISPPPL